MEWIRKNYLLFLIVSLTLGLAPFTEPHIWGKLKWIAGGGAFSGDTPMLLMDWLDSLMHGTPWLLLVFSASLNLKKLLKKDSNI